MIRWNSAIVFAIGFSSAVVVSSTMVRAETKRSVIAPVNRGAFPAISLPENLVQGQKALDHLGLNLPAIAAWYGRSPDELRALLINDKTTRLDRRGRLLYIDAISAKLPPLTAPQGLIEGQSLPLTETFKLHSKPGAKKTIYLDFNGGTLSGTAWASSTAAIAPAYTIDADPAFSDTELANIQAIWRQVAEDYAPFDVDVTTEAPVPSAITRTDDADDIYGTVALITTINVYPTCGCGGIAYVGVFNLTTDAYKPALVFHDNLANGNKYIAEAISHEVGHNIGLLHDGTATEEYYAGQGSGTTGWAPIMGVGYYQPLTQFSKGEYANASQKQDDFVVAQSYGLPIRSPSEDVGDTIGSATILPASADANGMRAAIDGVIETAADKDVYAFTTGSGSVSIQVYPVTTSPNLDVNMQLLTANGEIIVQSNPPDSLNASITTTLPSGTYFILVDGTGKGDPLTTGYSDYGSLGWYRVTAAYPAADALAPLASFTASRMTGAVPLTVTFDARSSSDPNGNNTIANYGWNFGDTTTGSGPIVTKTFTTTGSYNVTLTVTDETARTSTLTQTIIVNPATTPTTISVSDIAMKLKVQRSGSWSVSAVVTVKNASGLSISGATVSGTWSGNVNQTRSAVTNLSGTASFTSPVSKKPTGVIAFKVNSVVAPGYTYDSSKNLETEDSIAR